MLRFIIQRRSQNDIQRIACNSFRYFGTPQIWHRQDFMEKANADEKISWLLSMIQEQPSQVDVKAYSLVLKSIAATERPGAPHNIEAIISQMTVEPDDDCYESLLDAWVTSTSDDGEICRLRAERWFREIKNPTLITYHKILRIYSKGMIKYHTRARKKEFFLENAKNAEFILQSMKVPPDTEAYNLVIRAWSKVLHDPELRVAKVADIFGKMEKLHQENPHGSVSPNSKTFAMVMECYSELAGFRISSKTGTGLNEAKHVIDLVKHTHELQLRGFDDVAPGTAIYNILISTWARLSGSIYHPNALAKAEEILKQMMDSSVESIPQPDQISFSKVIQAWTNSKSDQAGEKALYWLQELKKYYIESGKNESIKTSIYNSVMLALKQNPRKVEEIFRELEDNRYKGVKPVPISESYSILIHAWAKYDIQRAYTWLQEVIEHESKNLEGTPAVVTVPDEFNVLLRNAAANCSLGNTFLALEVLEHYRHSRHPVNVDAYVCIMKCLIYCSEFLSQHQNLYPEETYQLKILKVLDDCVSDGLVSGPLVKFISSSPVFRVGYTSGLKEVIKERLFAVCPMPGEWTRNVPVDQLPN
jgi:hypothetical protein